MKSDYMDEIVQAYYSVDSVVERYASDITLRRTEAVLVEMLTDHIHNQPVLDIGVGPGRTTHTLSRMSPFYVGIDYSERMIRPCRQRYPDCELALCDARRICFPSATFESVLFLWNAIDDVNHPDRLNILGEIHRVLRPRGVFILAGHNLDCYIKPAWVFGGFSREGNWKELARENLRRSIKYFRDIIHHLRIRNRAFSTPEYSIVNDPSWGYRLLTYYMTWKQQVTQLQRAGFDDIQVFDEQARLLADGDRSSSPSLHYVAWKRP